MPTTRPLIHHILDDFTEPWGDQPAPVVVLHPGLAGNGRLYRQWVPVLADRYRVLRPDARGQGMSALPDGYEWSIDEFVSDVLAVLDHYGIERAHWVGASGGGIIGQHAAASAPDRLASLTLLATTPRFRSPTANVDDWLAPCSTVAMQVNSSGRIWSGALGRGIQPAPTGSSTRSCGHRSRRSPAFTAGSSPSICATSCGRSPARR